MNPLVPEKLRSAALARLWTLDASIRSYEDPARDYAWNWNLPGGVPGGGPPPGREEIESTLRDIFRRFETEERVEAPEQRAEPSAAGAAPVSSLVPAPDDHVIADKASADAPRAEDAAHAAAPMVGGTPSGEGDSATPEMRDADPHSAPAEAIQAAIFEPIPGPVLRRRHGGAMPG